MVLVTMAITITNTRPLPQAGNLRLLVSGALLVVLPHHLLLVMELIGPKIHLAISKALHMVVKPITVHPQAMVATIIGDKAENEVAITTMMDTEVAAIATGAMVVVIGETGDKKNDTKTAKEFKG